MKWLLGNKDYEVGEREMEDGVRGREMQGKGAGRKEASEGNRGGGEGKGLRTR